MPIVDISFNANGGYCSISNKTLEYGSTYGTLPIPTKTGYTFDGWYTSNSGGTKITSSTKVTTISNQNLYAHWTQNHVHSYTNEINKVATCTEDGIRTSTCSCGFSYTETIKSTGHTDLNNDGYCDTCKAEITLHTPSTPTQKNCKCICHKTDGFSKFIYRIVLVFWDLFGIKQTCDCGEYHYNVPTD